MIVAGAVEESLMASALVPLFAVAVVGSSEPCHHYLCHFASTPGAYSSSLVNLSTSVNDIRQVW
jgi:hypothetical protein